MTVRTAKAANSIQLTLRKTSALDTFRWKKAHKLILETVKTMSLFYAKIFTVLKILILEKPIVLKKLD